MRAVVTDVATLASRASLIRQMLQPITSHPSAPYCDVLRPTGAYVIGTHEGSPPSSEYRDWRFGTFITGINAMYFELWRPIDEKKRDYYLDRSFLSIFNYTGPDSSTEHEFFCLHCDPNEPEGEEHMRYKRVPHLHIKSVKEPFASAHLALLVGHPADFMLTSDEWSNSFEAAIEMLSEEVMKPLEEIRNAERYPPISAH